MSNISRFQLIISDISDILTIWILTILDILRCRVSMSKINSAPLRPERRASETSHARLNLIVTVFTRVCMPWPIVNSPSLCREARAPAVQPELRRSPIPISLHRLGRGGDDLEG